MLLTDGMRMLRPCKALHSDGVLLRSRVLAALCGGCRVLAVKLVSVLTEPGCQNSQYAYYLIMEFESTLVGQLRMLRIV